MGVEDVTLPESWRLAMLAAVDVAADPASVVELEPEAPRGSWRWKKSDGLVTCMLNIP